MAPMPSTMVQKMTGAISILIRPTNAVPSHLSDTANSGKAKPTAMPASTAPMTAMYSQWVRSRFLVAGGCPAAVPDAMTAPGGRPAAEACGVCRACIRGGGVHHSAVPGDQGHAFVHCVHAGPGVDRSHGTLAGVTLAALLAHRRRGDASLARRLLLLQALVVAVVVLTAMAVAYLDARQAVRTAAEEETTAIVESIADSPLVLDAVTGPDPTAVLQPYVEAVRADTGTSFITVLAPDRTRFTHPDPAQIGQPFIGTIDRALAGETFTETYTGTLGPSVRATGPGVDRSEERRVGKE